MKYNHKDGKDFDFLIGKSIIKVEEKELKDEYNDEIKEIEKYLYELISYTFTNENKKYILDYITNLQEENEMYAQLKEEYEKADYDRHKLFEQKEKAIEYIENNLIQNDITDYDYQFNYKIVLNILKGEDNEK